jgi:hypothetical protein
MANYELFSAIEKKTLSDKDFRTKRLNNFRSLGAIKSLLNNTSKTNKVVNGENLIDTFNKEVSSEKFYEAVNFFKSNIVLKKQGDEFFSYFTKDELPVSTFGAIISFFVKKDEELAKKIDMADVLATFYLNSLGGKNEINEIDVRKIIKPFEDYKAGRISKERFYELDNEIASQIRAFRSDLVSSYAKNHNIKLNDFQPYDDYHL